MKYSIKPKNDSDKENAKQLEFIMNNKFATYDDISEIIKERVDKFELKRPCIIDGHEALISKTESEIISFDQSINDFIIKQLDDSETNNWIKDLTEFGMAASYITSTPRGISIQSINPMDMHAVMPSVIGGLNHNIIIADDIELAKMRESSFLANRNTYYPRNYASKNTMELVDAILFQEEKQPKENHPYGWYRKFDKKRF